MVTLDRRQTLGAFGGGALALVAPVARAANAPGFEALDAIGTDAVAAGAAPGLQVAVGRAGALLYSRGFGLANLETGTPVTPDSVFRIASLTKAFTAAAVWRLAAAGTLSVDDPVSRTLPFMAALPAMSLLELMNHTAGLHSDDAAASPPPGPGPVTQVELARRIAAQPQALDFPPGTAWLYSNANYIVLGAVIEAVTGKPYAEAMAELVFRPLNLAATAVDRTDAIVRWRAAGYSAVESEAVAFANTPYIEIAEAGGAGAIRSTASDLCRWAGGLFTGRLFDRDVLARMTAPGVLRDGRLSGEQRFSPDDAVYGAVNYAAGLLVSPPDEAPASYLHYGGINGFCSMLETWPESGVTLAVLCNADRGPATPFRPLRQWVRARIQAGAFTAP